MLTGTINGEGERAKYRFQYGESVALGSKTRRAKGRVLVSEEVSGTIEGLHAGRIYYYRMVGEDEDGANYGLTREL